MLNVELQGIESMECEPTKISIGELKSMIEGLRDNVSLMQTRLERVN